MLYVAECPAPAAGTPIEERQATAKAGRLRDVSDGSPAIRRVHSGTGFACRMPQVLHPPAILDGYLDGSRLEALQRRMHAEHGRGLKVEEAAVMAFLPHRLEQDGNIPLEGRRRSSA